MVALLFPAAGSSVALGAEPTRETRPLVRPDGCPVVLDRSVSGRTAVDDLGTDLAAVARLNQMSVTRLRELLLTDSTLWVDPCGRLYYVDRAHPGTTVDRAPVGPMVFPASQTFLLHSRPGSKRVIYLDFTGAVVTGTAWNTSYGIPTITAPAYDTDANVGVFSDTEKAEIQDIWARVTEDYAPFDVDITTEDPGAAAIDRNGAADTVYGTRAVITSMHSLFCFGCAGIAYLRVFDDPNHHALYQPAWVFQPHGQPNVKEVAETISHEVGHNFGLSHDGGTPGGAYYEGHASWAPIMGSGSLPITQWSKGEYATATNQEDDIAIIASSGAPLRVDDHPDGLDPPLGVTRAGSGVIERRTDSDWFSFSGSGPTTIVVQPAAVSPNLDVGVELWSGATKLATAVKSDPVVASDDVASGLDASISMTLPAGGTYRLRGYGVGAGTASTGFTTYASLGQYKVAVAPAGAATDMALQVAVSPNPVPVEEDVTYNATVTNKGPFLAPATFIDTLPAGVIVVLDAVSSRGPCSGTDTITCPLGILLDGESATVRISMWIRNLDNTASVVTPNDLNPANNTVNTTTAVTPHLRIYQLSDVEAGSAGDIEVYIVDGDNEPVPTYRGTILFTSTDPTATLPADYTFTATDAGRHVFAASFRTAGSSEVIASDTATGSIKGSVGVYVVPAPLRKLVVGGLPTPRTAGEAGDITVTATDACGNRRDDYEGTVHFTSSDGEAVLPADYTSTSDDAGAHTFAVTLKTPGTHSITVTDTAPASVTGSQAGIVVTQANVVAAMTVGGPTSPRTAGTADTITVTAMDASGATLATYRGTVHFTSSDPKAFLPADYTFTAADAGSRTFPVTLQTVGSRSITVSDAAAPSLTATQAAIIVKAAALRKLIVTGLSTPRVVGSRGTVRVSATDAYGNRVSGYRAKVRFSSTDPKAKLPASYRFTASDGGRHSFSVILKSVGTWSVKATDTTKPSVTGRQKGIQVKRRL